MTGPEYHQSKATAHFRSGNSGLATGVSPSAPIDPWHAGIPILSIDFLGGPDAFYSNIFGVSGQ
jgi:hypothetical protein